MIHDPFFWAAIGAYAALLLVGWLAFARWTYRLRRPSPLVSRYIALETERDAFQTMLHVQVQASRLLCREVVDLKEQVRQLLGAQAMLVSI